MPSERRLGVPGLKRDKGATRSFSMPSADQSRCASSRSLSDRLSQTALRRPLIQLSRMMPATCRPLPQPVRSEERRVGQECASTCESRWLRDPSQNNQQQIPTKYDKYVTITQYNKCTT